MDIKKEAIVLFSGGIDCSLATCLLVEKKYKVHLLHYINGTSISNNLHKIRFDELKSVLGDKNVILNEINISGLFRKLSLETIEEDFRKYSTNLVCLGCRMGMHTETILYALKHNIKIVADGSIKYQNHFPEQSSVSLDLFKKLYEAYGIEYINPVLSLEDKKDVKYNLLNYGISIQSMEDTCLFSNTFSKAEDKNMSEYIEERLQYCDKYIIKKRSFLCDHDVNNVMVLNI